MISLFLLFAYVCQTKTFVHSLQPSYIWVIGNSKLKSTSATKESRSKCVSRYITIFTIIICYCITAFKLYIGMFSYKIETYYVSQRPLNMPCEVSTLSYPHTESIKALYKVRWLRFIQGILLNEKCTYLDNVYSITMSLHF